LTPHRNRLNEDILLSYKNIVLFANEQFRIENSHSYVAGKTDTPLVCASQG